MQQQAAIAAGLRQRLGLQSRHRVPQLAEQVEHVDVLTGLRNRRFLTSNIQQDVALVERFYANPQRDRRTPNDRLTGNASNRRNSFKVA